MVLLIHSTTSGYIHFFWTVIFIDAVKEYIFFFFFFSEVMFLAFIDLVVSYNLHIFHIFLK